MNNDRIAAIRERRLVARQFAVDCDRTTCGCQVPQIRTAIIDDMPLLLTEIVRLQSELSQKTQQLAASKLREQAAVVDIYTLANAASECVICKHRVGQSGCPLRYKNCRFDWRGPQEGGE